VHDIFVMLVITTAPGHDGATFVCALCVSRDRTAKAALSPHQHLSRRHTLVGLENSTWRHYIAGGVHSRTGAGLHAGHRHFTAGYASTRASPSAHL
jgi:hypothetical protein